MKLWFIGNGAYAEATTWYYARSIARTVHRNDDFDSVVREVEAEDERAVAGQSVTYARVAGEVKATGTPNGLGDGRPGHAGIGKSVALEGGRKDAKMASGVQKDGPPIVPTNGGNSAHPTNSSAKKGTARGVASGNGRG